MFFPPAVQFRSLVPRERKIPPGPKNGQREEKTTLWKEKRVQKGPLIFTRHKTTNVVGSFITLNAQKYRPDTQRIVPPKLYETAWSTKYFGAQEVFQFVFQFVIQYHNSQSCNFQFSHLFCCFYENKMDGHIHKQINVCAAPPSCILAALPSINADDMPFHCFDHPRNQSWMSIATMPYETQLSTSSRPSQAPTTTFSIYYYLSDPLLSSISALPKKPALLVSPSFATKPTATTLLSVLVPDNPSSSFGHSKVAT